MFQNKILENLELKLSQTRLEDKEKFDIIEQNFKSEFWVFLENIFPNDNSWIKRMVSAYFQLEKIDNESKNNTEIFSNSLKKSLENISLSKEKKEKLFTKITNLEKNKNFFEEKLTLSSDISKDTNYPILESLKEKEILTSSDLIDVSLKYKEKKNFLESINVLTEDKIEIIKKHFFELNDTKTEDRINNFKSDFKNEVESSKNLQIYPKVINFIWKNYFKLRLKNKVETKVERLRRMFKIAFLKLYRLKYSWIDITEILKKIETLSDLDSFVNLLLKFFEQLKQNPNLQKDYVVSDDIEEVENLVSEAENNKEKSIFTENKIIEASKLLEETEKKLTHDDLEKILSEEVDLVWWNFVDRSEKNENCKFIFSDLEKKEEIKEEDLFEIFENLKQELFETEEKKRKMFLLGNYDEIDILNDELIKILKKIEKIKKLLWIADSDEEDENLAVNNKEI